MADPCIRGILFDKDGTLFDFSRTWAEVVERTLDHVARSPEERHRMALTVGYDPDTGRFVAGSPIVAGAVEEVATIWADIRPDLGAGRIEDIVNTVTEAAVESGALAPAVPDLPGFLGGLRGMGVILGIATHDTEAAARQQMAAVGALDLFAFIAGYDSGHGLKPGPGMLFAFAATTGLDPSEIIMVGDSPGDLLVAPNAGAAMAIGVLTGPATADALTPYADHILPSIADLPALLFPR